jgi:hypothetical protein
VPQMNPVIIPDGNYCAGENRFQSFYAGGNEHEMDDNTQSGAVPTI